MLSGWEPRRPFLWRADPGRLEAGKGRPGGARRHALLGEGTRSATAARSALVLWWSPLVTEVLTTLRERPCVRECSRWSQRVSTALGRGRARGLW